MCMCVHACVRVCRGVCVCVYLKQTKYISANMPLVVQDMVREKIQSHLYICGSKQHVSQ